jgi:rod shape determining protein RodA
MFDKRYIKNFDYIIILLVLFLVCFGLIGIGIATRSPVEDPEADITNSIEHFNLRQVKLQIVWFVTGLVLMFIAVSIDYHVIAELSPWLYWIVIGLLIAVKVIGATGGGAQRWLALGPFRLQPSEFAKLALILMLARTLAKREEDGIHHIKELLPIAVQVAIPFALIYIQPDLGTALAFIAIVFGVLFAAGISWKLLALGGGIGLAAAPIAWFFIFEGYQKKRIEIFLNPGLDPLGDGYNVLQSMMAIGSGQIFGQVGVEGGILKGNTLSQLDFLPAKDTDFIFSVTAEALGFVGGITIIALYLFLILRIIRVASRARDKLGSFMTVGVASMILFHVFENIGMTMGLMPVTGLPLPFMSYGGSSMWTNMIAIGLVLNVGMRRHKLKF